MKRLFLCKIRQDTLYPIHRIVGKAAHLAGRRVFCFYRNYPKGVACWLDENDFADSSGFSQGKLNELPFMHVNDLRIVA